MEIRKRILMKMDSCYAVSIINRNGEKLCVAAPDTHGAAKAVVLKHNREERISSFPVLCAECREELLWREPSGTMGFVPLGDNGEFLAVQNFFPVFDSKHAVLVKGKFADEIGWIIRPFLHIPYMHRIDILCRNERRYLIICTLCSGKESADDWSQPGQVLVGVLPEDIEGIENKNIEMSCILEGQVKNHGYFKMKEYEKDDGQVDYDSCAAFDIALIASENGLFEIRPPREADGEWEINQLTKQPAGDVAACDIDQDDCMEYLIITPFHGSSFSICKRIENEIRQVWKMEEDIRFGHVAWAGRIHGKPAFICGCREKEASLVLIIYDKEREEDDEYRYKSAVIDKGQGPANICVLNEDGKDLVIAANAVAGEVAAYEIF